MNDHDLDLFNLKNPFVIAEAGINHNGDVNRALEMIDVAKVCGVDAIKFQTFKTEELIYDKKLEYTYYSQGKKFTESMQKLFKKYELKNKDWYRLKEECNSKNIHFISTPQNYSDLEILLDVGISVIKIGSDDFNNIPLIKKYVSTGKPIILSCGMADYSDIQLTLECAGYYDSYPLSLLLCISEYPASIENLNLNRIKTLKRIYPDLTIGFSDHSQGSLAASIATSLGAMIIEKHFTLDKNLHGPDHWFSSDPQELKDLVKIIKETYIALGNEVLFPCEEEYKMRNLARRSVVAKVDIVKGDTFKESNLDFKRPGDGLPPKMVYDIINKIANSNIKKGEQIKYGDFL